MYTDPASGEPVRFNACEPLHYVINPAHAPADAVADAHSAIKTVSGATGIRFVYDGTTSEAFSVTREPHQPDRYGDGWAPILLSWSPEPLDQLDPAGLGGDVIGLARPEYVMNDEGRAVYVTGEAVFDATDDLVDGRRPPWDEIILHELGHVMGLDHVDDPSSIMTPGLLVRPGGFGEGDRAGLWQLGLGSPCVGTPAVP